MLLDLGGRWGGGVHTRGHGYEVPTATHISSCHQRLLLYACVASYSTWELLLCLLDLPSIESIVDRNGGVRSRMEQWSRNGRAANHPCQNTSYKCIKTLRQRPIFKKKTSTYSYISLTVQSWGVILMNTKSAILSQDS